MHTNTKIGGNGPGILPKGAKTCFVFCPMWPFSHLSGIDFDHFETKDVHTPVKNFQISAQGLYRPKNS